MSDLRMEPTRERIAYLEGQLQSAHEEIKRLRYESNLGLASTEEMLRELITRFKLSLYETLPDVPATCLSDVERALVLAEMLGGMSAPEREYRTVDHG